MCVALNPYFPLVDGNKCENTNKKKRKLVLLGVN